MLGVLTLTIIVIGVLMAAMAIGVFTNAAFFSSTIRFVAIVGIHGYAMRDVPTHIT